MNPINNLLLISRFSFRENSIKISLTCLCFLQPESWLVKVKKNRNFIRWQNSHVHNFVSFYRIPSSAIPALESTSTTLSPYSV